MKSNPSSSEKLAILRNNWDMFGAAQTLRDIVVYVLSRRSDHFDDRHGVSTRGNVMPWDAAITDPVTLENAHNYEPTRERVMRHILRYVAQRLDPTTLTFIDLGCGKGRAVLMATALPFREVLGVEVSRPLCDVAEQNLARYAGIAGGDAKRDAALLGGPSKTGKAGSRSSRRVRCSNVRICCEDVTHFEPPRSDLLIYMFNSFRGPVLRAVLDRLAAFQQKEQRRVYVILSHPATEHVLATHPAFVQRDEFQVISPGSSWNFWECDATVASPHPGRGAVTPISPATTQLERESA